MNMNVADISPDGSQIVYDRYNASTSLWEIATVSVVGGSGKTIVDGGVFPRWRPDGQRIGYVRGKDRGSQSGKAELWTIRSNGSENRCELVDSVSSRTTAFAWSPDGRSVCWIRSFSPRQWSEIFLHDLSTGKERQVTFDKKFIGDVCWASNDRIVFASNRGGNNNLWMVPASGGPVTQVTKGPGPDYSLDISRDGSKLVYFQQQEVSHIWIAGTDGSHPHQITFDDAFLFRVAFSSDGKEIMFMYSQPQSLKEGALVCSINRDGRNRKELTSGYEGIGNPIPSPDGRWIIYARRPLSTPRESLMVYLIDTKKLGIPKRVGKGAPFRWVNEKSFISFDYNDSTQSTWLNRIDGGNPQKFFEDSTLAFPLQGGKYVGYYNFRSGRLGLWIGAAPGVKDSSLPSPKQLVSMVWGEFDKSGKFFYYVKNAGELRRISIPSGKEEIIRGVFPGLNPTFLHSTFDISYDGKEIVYTDARYNSKLVMIENPFK
jgi:Tol biopolymer transport system component